MIREVEMCSVVNLEIDIYSPITAGMAVAQEHVAKTTRYQCRENHEQQNQRREDTEQIAEHMRIVTRWRWPRHPILVALMVGRKLSDVRRWRKWCDDVVYICRNMKLQTA